MTVDFHNILNPTADVSVGVCRRVNGEEEETDRDTKRVMVLDVMCLCVFLLCSGLQIATEVNQLQVGNQMVDDPGQLTLRKTMQHQFNLLREEVELRTTPEPGGLSGPVLPLKHLGMSPMSPCLFLQILFE
ncbi:hypothetical protein QQF64_020244, partial [Cirrhinus molitorella]